MAYSVETARKTIKYVAKDALSGRWTQLLKFTIPSAILTVTAFFIEQMAVPAPGVFGDQNLAGYLATLRTQLPARSAALLLTLGLGILLRGPLELCLASFFLERSAPEAIRAERNRPRAEPAELPSAWTFFGWFLEGRKLAKSVLLKLCTAVLSALVTCVAMVPGFILLGRYLTGAESMAALRTAGSLMATGYLAAYIYTGRWMLSRYFLAQEPDLPVREALRRSVEITRGHVMEYFLFRVSFLLWDAVSFLSFGAAMVYALPYRQTCEAIFVRYLDMDGAYESAYERHAE